MLCAWLIIYLNHMNAVCTVKAYVHLCFVPFPPVCDLGFESSARSLMALESALLALSLLFSTFLPASSKKDLISFFLFIVLYFLGCHDCPIQLF